MKKSGKGIIYLITNKVNGKQYVGFASSSIKKRWKSHVNDARKGKDDGMIILRAIRKYKPKSFTIELLKEYPTAQQAIQKEEYWIQKLNTRTPNGYNVATGGDVPMLGRTHTKEAREKISKARMGNQFWLGRHHTSASKKKIGKANRGRKKSKESVARQTKSLIENGNMVLGENHYKAKLTNQSVRLIKEWLLRDIYAKPDIAKQFNISIARINCIIYGTSWKHVKVKGFPEQLEKPAICGEKSRTAKLTEQDVINIRKEFFSSPNRRKNNSLELAQKYNVSQSTIWLIANRRSWKHVK